MHMDKKIDLSKPVYDLVKQYPELTDIMVELGFSEITKKVLLNSVGKFMTIPKGAAMRGIAMTDIVMALQKHGFTLASEQPSGAQSGMTGLKYAPNERNEKLKSYLKRLGKGESLESVRADFKAEFSDVEAAEIMQAEQELMAEGTPLREVQQLCDVHSALFHGATREEQIMNAEREVAASVDRTEQAHAMAASHAQEAAALLAVDGHPVQTFMRENQALETLLVEAFKAAETRTSVEELLPRLREIGIHYAKKGDLLFPHLKVKYNISGPSQVMWTIDDEIRDELASLAKNANHDDAWWQRFKDVCVHMKEMIYKENNILLPICVANFTEDEWHNLYQDSKDYAPCFGITPHEWPAAEAKKHAIPQHEGEIVMPGGHLTLEQLTTMLDTLPMEITFVDADNFNRYFNDGEKVFKRPSMAIDREVFSCHPPKIEPMVRAIISDLRAGKRDQLPIWMEKNGKPYLVNYMAVRDKAGNYVGTVEVVQDMSFAKDHFLPSK